MSAIRLRGATSGTTDVVAAAIAGDGVLTLPTGTGTLATAAYVDAAVAAGGKVLQVVRAIDATQRTTTSTSFVDGTLSVTITPQKSTSAILLFYSVVFASNGSIVMHLQITDNSNVAINGSESSTLYSSAGQIVARQTLIAYDSPATLSAVTYKIRFKTSSGIASLNNQESTGQLYAIEVAA